MKQIDTTGVPPSDTGRCLLRTPQYHPLERERIKRQTIVKRRFRTVRKPNKPLLLAPRPNSS